MSRLVKVTVEIEQPSADVYYTTNRIPSGPSKIAAEAYTGDSELSVAQFVVRVAELVHADAAKRDEPAKQEVKWAVVDAPAKPTRARRK